MAHYTLLKLSDLHDIVTFMVVVRSKNPLVGANIRDIDELPECEIMDFESGKILSWIDIEGAKYVSVGQEFSKTEIKDLLARIEKYHQHEIDFVKEFLGV